MARREETRTVQVEALCSVIVCDYCHTELSAGPEDWYDKHAAAGWTVLLLGRQGRSASKSLDVCPKCAVGVGEMMAKKSAASGGPASGGNRG